MIRTGTIFVWTGLIADIPSGWERETSLDGRFTKGTPALTDPNVQGGSDTHTHTSPSHTHTLTGHSHTITVGGSYGAQRGTSDSSGSSSRVGHTHTGSTSSTVDGNLSSVTSTYDTASNNPPFHEVIYIKPTSNKSSLADGIIAFSDDSSFVDNSGKWSGFYKCDGNNSTPNINGKYLRGAGTGQEAGTTGGSTTNVHSLVHSHSVASHTHAFSTGASVQDGRDSDASTTYEINTNHTHSGNLSSATDTITSSTPSITTTETVEPDYRKIMLVQNKSGKGLLPLGLIGMWLGSLGSIPRGWILCDGSNGTQDMRGKYAKITSDPLYIGDVGGSNTHTHSGNTHAHSGSHTHPTTTVGHTASIDRGGSTAYIWVASVSGGAHSHNITTNTVSTSYSTEYTNAESSSNEPLYTTVAYIKLVAKGGGGILLLDD